MLLTLLQVVGGLALLYFGGEALVRGAANMALRLGLTPLLVGLTVVAFGTSAPELVVSLRAAWSGADDVAVGNVVGSNICNVALILGLAALIRPIEVKTQVVKFDAPVVIVCSLVLALVLADGTVSRAEGASLFAGLLLYIGLNYWASRRERKAAAVEVDTEVPVARGWRKAIDPLLILAGLAMLVVGGHFLVEAAIELAKGFGVSEAVIGLTIVAVGTSLPELATSMIASARGQGDIAVGNVVGSNVFNILCIVGITSMVTPLARGGIGWADIGVMTFIAVLLLPLLCTGLRLVRWEGAVLLAGYIGYVGWRVAMA